MIKSKTFFLFFEKEHANINSIFFAVNSILFTTRHFECDEENLRQMLRIFANFTETGETANTADQILRWLEQRVDCNQPIGGQHGSY